MENLSTDDYLRIIQILTSAQDNNQLDLIELFKKNIKLINTLFTSHSIYHELHDFIKESHSNLASAHLVLEEVSSEVLLKLFNEWILLLLELYSLALTKEMRIFKKKNKFSNQSFSPETLNLKQQKHLFSALDFIFILGISINLEKGVGVPEEKKTLVMKNLEFIFKKEPNYEILGSTVQILMDLYELKFSNMFKHYIEQNYMNFYLAALFQLAFGPSSKIYIENNKALSSDKGKFKTYLNDLLSVLDPSIIIRNLLMLVGTPRKLNHLENEIEATNPTPRWLMSRCSWYLRQCLMREEGLRDFIFCLAEEIGDQIYESKTETGKNKPSCIEWKKCQAISRIVLELPLSNFSPTKFFSCLAEQVIGLIQKIYFPMVETSTPQSYRSIVPILVLIMEELNKKHFAIFFITVIQPLLHPLISISTSSQSVSSSFNQLQISSDLLNLEEESETVLKDVISEFELTSCVVTLHEILVIFHEPSSTLCSFLFPFGIIIHNIFQVACQNNSFLKPSLEELLTLLFSKMNCYSMLALVKEISGLDQRDENLIEQVESIQDIYALWRDKNKNTSKFLRLTKNLKVKSGSEGGLKVVKVSKVGSKKFCEIGLIECQCGIILDLVIQSGNMKFLQTFFLDCLQGLVNITLKEMQEMKKIVFPGQSMDVKKWTNDMTLLTLLSGLSDYYEQITISSFEQIVDFSKAILERSVLMMSKGFEPNTFQNESIQFIITILITLFLQYDKITNSQWDYAGILIPSLRSLSNNCPMETIKTACFEMMKLISTNGKISSELKRQSFEWQKEKIKVQEIKEEEKLKVEKFKFQQETCDVDFQEKKKVVKNVRFVDKVCHKTLEENEDSNDGMDSNNNSKKKEEVEKLEFSKDLKKIFNEINDPLIPVKGHGLIELKKFIEKYENDEVKLFKKDLFNICVLNIKHQDSYVYLSAISALFNLVSRFHRDLMISTIDLYVEFSLTTNKKNLDMSLKFGEALLKTIRSLGQMVFIYKEKLFWAFHEAYHSEESSVRASTIANLSQLCSQLKFFISSQIFGVIRSINNILRNEPCHEVRRAAAFFIVELLKGTSSDTFKILGEVLVDLYRLLKDAFNYDKDDIVRLQAQLGLEQLDNIMKKFINPSQTLEKKINILHSPSFNIRF